MKLATPSVDTACLPCSAGQRVLLLSFTLEAYYDLLSPQQETGTRHLVAYLGVGVATVWPRGRNRSRVECYHRVATVELTNAP